MQIKQFTFNPFQENTYVVYNDEKDALVIDPGCYTEEEEKKLNEFITSNKLNVRNLINTHLHIDHVLGNAFTEKTYNVKASANANDESWLKEMENQATMFGLPLRHTTSPIGHRIKNGDKIALGAEIFEVLEIPGHTASDIALYNAENKSIFVGDILFQGSVGRTDLQGGNYQSLIESIHNKLLTLPDNTVVYCGHGPNTTIGEEKLNNPYL